MYTKSVIVNQVKTFLDKQFKVDSGTISKKQKTLHQLTIYWTFFSYNKNEIKTFVNVFVKTLILRLHFYL